MFEDIEDFLKHNRPGGLDDHGNNNDRPRKIDRNPSPEELADLLAREFGGTAEVIAGGRGVSLTRPHAGKFADEKIKGLVETIMYFGKQLNVIPSCQDAVGKEIKVGNVLKVPGGASKMVLEVGFKFCILSRTDDHAKNDGAWFETEIKKGNFILWATTSTNGELK